ncbi:MAG: cell division protein FtsH, partial [Chlamydiota bacterium]
MKPDSKRGFPGGFFIFLLLAVLIILTVQNLNNEKNAKVSFSHQVEHLVNLDLIQKEDNRKIALNDNLVTFTGKFKDRQTDDAKTRFRYLELLSRNHELEGQKSELDASLTTSKLSV